MPESRVPGMLRNAAPVAQQIQVTREIVIHKAAIQVMAHPSGQEGAKVLRFVCPDGVAYGIPLDTAGVEAVVQALKGTGLTIGRGAILPGL